jgi:acetate kinase
MRHTRPEKIGPELLKELDLISDYDPDHLPAEIVMIQLMAMRHPGILQIACFDTAFHAELPRLAKLLPIPRRFDQAGIQRYGFHGLSYSYLMEALENAYGREETRGRIILAHLGSGASLAAVKEGKSIDTSMGFTAAGGLVMGSRTGELDPGAAWYMINKEGMTASQFNHLINHESGLLGVSEISSNMEELLDIEIGDPRAQEAVGLFCYSVKKWIGAFMAALGGLDTLVFSGGIGENSAVIRSRICEGLEFAGIELDESENKKNATQISNNESRVRVLVIPTNEELIIAKNAISIYIESENDKQ